MNKLQLMRQLLERDEKQRRRKELLLMFLWLIAILGGMVLAAWLWILNYYLVCIPASLALIAWLVYCVIKAIRTGEWRYRQDGRNYAYTRKDDPCFFGSWLFLHVLV